MQMRLKSTKMESSEAITLYFQEKVDMLEKYLSGVQVLNCDCEIEKVGGEQHSGKVFRAEINLEVPGSLLRVEKEAEDMYKAIDKAKDHMVEIIKKYKDTRK